MNEQNYWTNRYQEENTGWDIGQVSRPLREYIDQLKNKELSILIPGAGNAHEAEYLVGKGFKNVSVLDISETPLKNFQERMPSFPSENLIHGDFFSHKGRYDLIIEQTFFCSFEPTKVNRKKYALQISSLLKPSGKLVGLWFNHPLLEDGNRPFGGSKNEYESYLSPHFKTAVFENCYNSIEPRQGSELFGIFQKI